MSDERPSDGIVYAVIAYGLWGFFPLYWALLRDAPAGEVLGHRILGTFVLMLVLLGATGGFGAVRALTGRQWGLLAVASALVSSNWLTYIWGVQQHLVLETSLGYFINPLVTVAIGVWVLGERLRRAQIAALCIAAAAVIGITVELGRLPYVALVLALTFAAYGLVKKKAGAPPLVSVWVETALVALPAAGWLAHLHAVGMDTLFDGTPRHAMLLLASGFVTAAPLLAFAAAANRVPFVVLGLLQYLSPSLQFLCAVALLGEHMSAARWIGFGLVWIALIVFTVDAVRAGRVREAS